MDSLPSQQTLQEILDYDPRNGKLVWRERGANWFVGNARFSPEAAANMWNGRNAGKEAFQRINANGYKVGCILGHGALAHRVIWKLATGEAPITIDHINGVKSDNRLENLRSVPQGENNKNKPRFSNNKSGHAGISKTPYGQWKVQIGDSGYVGCYQDLDTAIAARADAERAYGYHQNHGRTERNGA